MVTGRRSIFIGSRVRISAGARLEAVQHEGSRGRVFIEDDVTIEESGHIGAADSVRIGAGTTIGSLVTILDHDHGLPHQLSKVLFEPLVARPVDIGKYVWIGDKATVLKGVSIGDGAVIGANAVVTSDIPSGGIAAGVPARVLKIRPIE